MVLLPIIRNALNTEWFRWLLTQTSFMSTVKRLQLVKAASQVITAHLLLELLSFQCSAMLRTNPASCWMKEHETRGLRECYQKPCESLTFFFFKEFFF